MANFSVVLPYVNSGIALVQAQPRNKPHGVLISSGFLAKIRYFLGRIGGEGRGGEGRVGEGKVVGWRYGGCSSFFFLFAKTLLT